jgi:hypothetical protein
LVSVEIGRRHQVGAIKLGREFMANRDGTCFAPGFGTRNGGEKRQKPENRNWGPETGKWVKIWGIFPVFRCTSGFFSNQCNPLAPPRPGETENDAQTKRSGRLAPLFN